MRHVDRFFLFLIIFVIVNARKSSRSSISEIFGLSFSILLILKSSQLC